MELADTESARATNRSEHYKKYYKASKKEPNKQTSQHISIQYAHIYFRYLGFTYVLVALRNKTIIDEPILVTPFSWTWRGLGRRLRGGVTQAAWLHSCVVVNKGLIGFRRNESPLTKSLQGQLFLRHKIPSPSDERSDEPCTDSWLWLSEYSSFEL